MNRKPSHRPASGAASSGTSASCRIDRRTRSRVSGGRLCVRMSSARSSAAAGATQQARHALQIPGRDSLAGPDLLETELRTLERAADPVEHRRDVSSSVTFTRYELATTSAYTTRYETCSSGYWARISQPRYVNAVSA